MNDSLNEKVVSTGKHYNYREAADRIWEMAKDYEKLGLKELAATLKDIATEIHSLARAKQVEEALDHSNKDV
jgi:hypothetical protein